MDVGGLAGREMQMNWADWVSVVGIIILVALDAYDFFFPERRMERSYKRTSEDLKWNRDVK
jgi:hypothetical protein